MRKVTRLAQWLLPSDCFPEEDASPERTVVLTKVSWPSPDYSSTPTSLWIHVWDSWDAGAQVWARPAGSGNSPPSQGCRITVKKNQSWFKPQSFGEVCNKATNNQQLYLTWQAFVLSLHLADTVFFIIRRFVAAVCQASLSVTALAHFPSLCHTLVIFATFKIFSLLLCLMVIWNQWSLTSVLWLTEGSNDD